MPDFPVLSGTELRGKVTSQSMRSTLEPESGRRTGTLGS